MNKHDELIARMQTNIHFVYKDFAKKDYSEAIDLLQFYGDALENMANGDVPRVTDTERHTDVLSLETYAQKTVEGE